MESKVVPRDDNTATSPKTKPARVKQAILGLFVIAVATSLGVLYVSTRVGDNSNSVPAPQEIVSAQASSNLKIFFPSKLPKGFKLDTTSTRVTSEFVAYGFNYGDNQKLVVTIQQKPEGVIFDDFYSRVLQHKADVFNNNGKAVIGNADGKTIGSLVTDKQWVLLSTGQQIDNQDYTEIIASLAPVR